MAENSKIEWCDHTVNFWWGCTKVSPACLNCYAERQDAHFHPHLAPRDRFQGEKALPSHWGPEAPRLLRVEAATREAMRYERQAVAEGRRFRVFTNSMSDFFEDRRDLDQVRLQALDVIRRAPHLDWLILTKRPEAILGALKRAERETDSTGMSDWLRAWMGWEAFPQVPANVWIGTTVEAQGQAEQRMWDLIKVPAAVRFLSCEPLLGPLDLRLMDNWVGYTPARNLINWVICGGESGPGARPMHPSWARGLRDQCEAAGVPFLFKQWGEWAPATGDLWWNPLLGGPQFPVTAGGALTRAWGDGYGAVKIGKARAGRLLDGVEHNGYPEVTHAQD
jgi:protein gp37